MRLSIDPALAYPPSIHSGQICRWAEWHLQAKSVGPAPLICSEILVRFRGENCSRLEKLRFPLATLTFRHKIHN
jgi:hypothetical protein